MVNLNNRDERRKNQWMIKSDKIVKKEFDEIRRFRFEKKLDNELIPYSELIKASLRFDPLKDILKKANIKRNENE